MSVWPHGKTRLHGEAKRFTWFLDASPVGWRIVSQSFSHQSRQWKNSVEDQAYFDMSNVPSHFHSSHTKPLPSSSIQFPKKRTAPQPHLAVGRWREAAGSHRSCHPGSGLKLPCTTGGWVLGAHDYTIESIVVSKWIWLVYCIVSEYDSGK